MLRRCCCCFVLSFIFSAATVGRAEEQKAARPELKLATPFVVQRGATTQVVLRGLRLDQTSEIRASHGHSFLRVNLDNKAASPPPNGLDAQRVGDSEVKLSIELAAGYPNELITLVAVTPEGESQAFELKVLPADSIAAEQEPNDGYESAQPFADGKIVVGLIHEPRNVDVYQIRVHGGQRFTAEITASMANSPLDPLLMLCDRRGTILCSADDTETSRDPVLRWDVTSDAELLLCVMDANDSGSSLHGYTLEVRVEDAE